MYFVLNNKLCFDNVDDGHVRGEDDNGIDDDDDGNYENDDDDGLIMMVL